VHVEGTTLVAYRRDPAAGEPARER
jgi:hypothetical protein